MCRCCVQSLTSGRLWQRFYGCSGVLAVLQQSRDWLWLKTTEHIKKPSNRQSLPSALSLCGRAARGLVGSPVTLSTSGRSLVAIRLGQSRLRVNSAQVPHQEPVSQFPLQQYVYCDRPHHSVQYRDACCLCVPVGTPSVAPVAADLVARFCSWNTWLTP
jgi:hypothetical protein